MANIDEPIADDLRSALAGANYLVNGQAGNTAPLANLSANALNTMLSPIYRGIDSNIIPKRPSATAADAMSNTGTGTGAKDRLKEIIDITKKAGMPVTMEHREVLESMMYMTGYNVTFDDRFDGDEKAEFEKFAQALEDNNYALLDVREMSAEETARIAVEAEVAAERAAAVAAKQEEVTGLVKAGLIESGYLDLADAQSPESVVFAMEALLVDHQTTLNVHTEINKSFDIQNGYAPTQDAVDLVRKLTTGDANPALFESHFNSGNTMLQGVAQSYMDLHGMDWEAGNALANGPLTIPEGILMSNGEVDYGELMIAATHGQLYLPKTADEFSKALGDNVSPENRAAMIETYNALPLQADRTAGDFMSREQYVASMLIDEDITRYEAYLDNVNEARMPKPAAPAVAPQAVQMLDGLEAKGVDTRKLMVGDADVAEVYNADIEIAMGEDSLAPKSLPPTGPIASIFQKDAEGPTGKIQLFDVFCKQAANVMPAASDATPAAPKHTMEELLAMPEDERKAALGLDQGPSAFERAINPTFANTLGL